MYYYGFLCGCGDRTQVLMLVEQALLPLVSPELPPSQPLLLSLAEGKAFLGETQVLKTDHLRWSHSALSHESGSLICGHSQVPYTSLALLQALPRIASHISTLWFEHEVLHFRFPF